MPYENQTIVGDLGGSYLRLAILDVNGPEKIQRISVSDYKNLAEALHFYFEKTGIIKYQKNRTLLLSFARKEAPNGRYEFDYKKNTWGFTTGDIKEKFNLDRFDVIHDATAMGLSTLTHRSSVFNFVKGSSTRGHGKSAVILCGTGVGHSFIDRDNHTVLDTHGGHFPPCFTTPKQTEILQNVDTYLRAKRKREGDQDRSLIFEDITSGDGLYNLYVALCKINSRNCDYADIREMLPNVNNQYVIEASKYYSQFLGLYAHVIANVNYAYNSLYLCGGHLERMNQSKLFNWDEFYKSFLRNEVQIVDQDLRSVPIYIVNAEHTALYGLEVYAQIKGL